MYHKQRTIGVHVLCKDLLIKEWESLQNVCVNSSNKTATNIEWASRVVQALWTYSKQIWDGRCEFIHEKNPITSRSLKTDEILKILQQEIDTVRSQRMAYDTKKLLENIESNKAKARDQTIYKWMDMLRHRKEDDIQKRRHDQIFRPRAQAITKWFHRSGDT